MGANGWRISTRMGGLSLELYLLLESSQELHVDKLESYNPGGNP